MGFRFRIGPFTFGRSGTRLSLWSRGAGVSVPLSGKSRSFGKIRVGPLSWYSEQAAENETGSPSSNDEEYSNNTENYASKAISAFQADRQFLQRIQKFGIPWRGIQERLKEELPLHLPDLDNIAYKLVPKAMESSFGQQGLVWSTESRKAKDGNGHTTWVVVKPS